MSMIPNRKHRVAGIPRIESLKVENFRALRDVEFKDLTPMTVLLGPNGSGKSTVFDVFNFLSECFQSGLRHAWDRRGRSKELKTRGADGPIEFQLKYRERPASPIITYALAIDEGAKGPVVVEESLRWRRQQSGKPFTFLEFHNGVGVAVSGEDPDELTQRISTELSSPDVIAASMLGQLSEHPRVAALRVFITDWYVSYLSVEKTREQPESGPQEHLSKSGDNLPNVIQYLKERHPDCLEHIFQVLRQRVPRLENVISEQMPNGNLLLQIKDAPFDQPILAKFASDGTMKMLSYLTVLYDPEPPHFIGLEEPENFLHPRLLPELAEVCREASANSQLLITSHSPFFLNAMKPREVRILYRDELGFTKAKQASEIKGIQEQIDQGGKLGDLWMEGFFGVGDPLTNLGGPQASRRGRG